MTLNGAHPLAALREGYETRTNRVGGRTPEDDGPRPGHRHSLSLDDAVRAVKRPDATRTTQATYANRFPSSAACAATSRA
jgi:hypothetical protein